MPIQLQRAKVLVMHHFQRLRRRQLSSPGVTPWLDLKEQPSVLCRECNQLLKGDRIERGLNLPAQPTGGPKFKKTIVVGATARYNPSVMQLDN